MVADALALVCDLEVAAQAGAETLSEGYSDPSLFHFQRFAPLTREQEAFPGSGLGEFDEASVNDFLVERDRSYARFILHLLPNGFVGDPHAPYPVDFLNIVPAKLPQFLAATALEKSQQRKPSIK